MLGVLRDDTRGDASTTLDHPDHVATVDVVGGKRRAERARTEAPGPAARAEPRDRGRGAAVGRYQLLELVGTGGMGIVWGAWDPELERRVALKLVQLTSRESRDRMLREGQVLARFSHPNVVPIFDVGELGDQVFLVMEWVRGTTLRAYAEQRPGRRALLDAYRQAAQGLAAAHRAGVIHRDFKPDNAIRGDDGRVRVLDFGLAHASAPRAERTIDRAGTPRYMAPEQVRGDATAAVDQFAFCVALREALEHGSAMPAWIAAIVARGTATDPALRFASMAELLAALERDPVSRWRQRAIGVTAAAIAIGGFAIGRSGAPVMPAIEPCSGGRAELAAAWRPEVRDRIAGHLRGRAVTAADIDGTIRKLDEYAERWVGEHRGTCEANLRTASTPQLHDARLSCLRRARFQLAAVVELLDRTSTAPDVVAAQSAIGALPDARECQRAGPVSPPPATAAAQIQAVSQRIERTWVLATARQRDALVDARAVTAEARRTGYKPVIARALLVEGWAAVVVDQPEAYVALDQAWQVALASFDEPLAVEAYARWVYAEVRMAPSVASENAVDRTPAMQMWPAMRVIAERLGDDGRFARALLYNNVALQRMVAHDKQGALELLVLARRSAGDDPPIELVAIDENLARLEPDPAECERQLHAAFVRKQAVLGSTHPDTLGALRNLAIVTRERTRARAVFAIACEGLREREQTGALQRCAYEAGWVADEDGDLTAARAAMATAAGLPDVRGRIASAYIAVADGSASRDVLTELERVGSQQLPAWLDRLNAADALVVLARAAERTAGAPGGAEVDRAWHRVHEMLETIDYAHFHRRKARARAEMAERWASSRPADARGLAAQALAWYRGVSGDEALVARLERVGALPGARPSPR
jgi:eukaryotic-like serine/threonine-protein kinase